MLWFIGALWVSILFGPLLDTGPAAAQEAGWIGGAAYRTRIRVGANGETWIGVWVDAPESGAVPQQRAPMAVSLVIDTSGSMAGEKIHNARIAASSLLETLGDGDIVSIYGFNNGVTEIAAPTVLSRTSRAMLMQGIQRISASGGTNMWDGLQVGITRMAQAPATHSVRRIFLISDGHANIGPSDPVSLGNLAANGTESGAQITAIGVGYDYDQSTLGALAVRSSGRVHHLGQPHQMSSILEQELALLSRSVAINAHIEVVPEPGVTILEGVTPGAVVENGRLRFPLGAMYAGQKREILFRARLDTAQLGSRPLATARLAYHTPVERTRREQSTRLTYEVTRTNGGDSDIAPRVAAMLADHEAARAQREAAVLMQQGQARRAAVVLREAQQRVEQRVRSAPRPVRARMQSRASSLGRASRSAASASDQAEMRARSYDFADEAMEAEGF